METVSLLLCPPKSPIWTCKRQTTCWICYFAKVLKVARNILPEGDQFSTSFPSNSTTSKNKSDETMQILIKDFWSLLGWYQYLNSWGHASLHRELACFFDLQLNLGQNFYKIDVAFWMRQVTIAESIALRNIVQIKCWSVRCIPANLSMLRKVFTKLSSLLQQSFSKYFSFSFSPVTHVFRSLPSTYLCLLQHVRWNHPKVQ